MIRIFSYSRETNRMESPTIGELPRHLSGRGRTIWVDLEAPTDEETGVLGGIFGFHVLAVEDCIDDAFLPKRDDYDGYTYMIFHAADPSRTDRFETEKVDVFAGPNFLVTHHEKEVKGISDTRGVVAKNPGSLLRSPDWLLHGILNAVVDNYQPAVSGLEARITRAESSVAAGEAADVGDVLVARRELLWLERLADLQHYMVAELGDAASGPAASGFVQDENRVYFRDVADHLRHLRHRASVHAAVAVSTTTAATATTASDSRAAHAGSRWSAISLAAVLLGLLLTAFYSTNFVTLPGMESGQGPYVIGVLAVIYAFVAGVRMRRTRWRRSGDAHG